MKRKDKPQVRLQFREEIQHLRLHRDIERGDRLVGDDEARMRSDRARNRNALPLSSGQFVRIAVEERAREIDAVEQFRHAIDDFRFRGESEVDERLGDLVAQSAERIERRKRILKHHLHVSARFAQFGLPETADLPAVEP